MAGNVIEEIQMLLALTFTKTFYMSLYSFTLVFLTVSLDKQCMRRGFTNFTIFYLLNSPSFGMQFLITSIQSKNLFKTLNFTS